MTSPVRILLVLLAFILIMFLISDAWQVRADSTVYDADLNYQGQVYGGQVYDEDNNYRGYQSDDGDLYGRELDYRGRTYGDDDASVILLDDNYR